MGFLKKIFGSSDKTERPDKPYIDTQGIYLYVQCDRCGAPVRLRADKQYDLINEGGGFIWHKTIVDNRCFRPMPTIVRFDGSYNIVDHDIKGGRYITEEEYNALLTAADTPGESAETGTPA